MANIGVTKQMLDVQVENDSDDGLCLTMHQ